jgi:hypothetical protein
MEKIFIVKAIDEKKDISYLSDVGRITKDIEKSLAITKKKYQLFKDSFKKFYNKEFLEIPIIEDYLDVDLELIEVSRDIYTRKIMGDVDRWAKPYPLEDLISRCEDKLKSKKIEFDEQQEEQDYLENEIYELEKELKELKQEVK